MSQTHMSRLNSLTGTSSSSRRERVRAWKSAVDSVSLRYVNDATIPPATPIDACCLLDVRCTQNSLDTHMLFRHFVHTFAEQHRKKSQGRLALVDILKTKPLTIQITSALCSSHQPWPSRPCPSSTAFRQRISS